MAIRVGESFAKKNQDSSKSIFFAACRWPNCSAGSSGYFNFMHCISERTAALTMRRMFFYHQPARCTRDNPSMQSPGSHPHKLPCIRSSRLFLPHQPPRISNSYLAYRCGLKTLFLLFFRDMKKELHNTYAIAITVSFEVSDILQTIIEKLLDVSCCLRW